MKMVVNNNLVNAAIKKYEAQIEEALATLHIYFSNSVGIGEHPDLLTEVDKYVELLESASGKLEVLQKFFAKSQQQEQPKEQELQDLQE